MPFKTITIKENTYKKILRSKKHGESFSELFERTFGEEKSNLQPYFGAWKMSKTEATQFKKELATMRKEADRSFDRRMSRVLSRL